MNNKKRPGVMLYFDVIPALEKLPMEKVGKLFIAAMRYAQSGTIPSFDDPLLDFAWALMRPSIDRDEETYEKKQAMGKWMAYCKKCKSSGTEPLDFDDWQQQIDNGTLTCGNGTLPAVTCGNDTLRHVTNTTTTPSTTTTTTTTPSTDCGAAKPPAPTRRRFVPPTLEEVTEYVKKRGSRVDPQGFIDFYQAKGWKMGRTPMKDWKAACRNAESWERWDRYGSGKKERAETGRDFQASPERIQKNAEWLDEFLASQEESK